MGKKIQIICTNPGMRRHGIAHPASATYEPDRWSDDDLAAFRADPSFHVNEIDEGGVVTKGDEFDKAVAAEVEKRMAAEAEKLRDTFASAVAAAAAEKVDAAEKRVKELEARVAEMAAAKPKAGKA